MKSIKKLNSGIPTNITNELDSFLTNTGLYKDQQVKLIEIINKIYLSGVRHVAKHEDERNFDVPN